ncbi:MAG: PAS domain-containing protein [Gemmatimonadaceae bacterium]|nr:PAS domain-containing protein [Gemmatimonadaceae bacterium]
MRGAAQRRRLLTQAVPMADGIAALLFPFAEVVVHDLASQTVVHIANNLSRRELGDASALADLERDSLHDMIGPYEKRNWDGGRMRSVSVLIRDDAGTARGLVCINLDIAVFEQARATLELFVRGVRVMPQPEQLFRDDWQERINTFLHAWLAERRLAITGLTRTQKRELVCALERDGAFRGRSAANYVSNVLGMGRATVFKYLREVRSDTVTAVGH